MAERPPGLGAPVGAPPREWLAGPTNAVGIAPTVRPRRRFDEAGVLRRRQVVFGGAEGGLVAVPEQKGAQRLRRGPVVRC